MDDDDDHDDKEAGGGGGGSAEVPAAPATATPAPTTAAAAAARLVVPAQMAGTSRRMAGIFRDVMQTCYIASVTVKMMNSFSYITCIIYMSMTEKNIMINCFSLTLKMTHIRVGLLG